MKSLALLALLTGCGAATPRPRVLSDLEQTRNSAAVIDANQRAPQAIARARDLERRAEAAQAADDSASAQIIGEQALAAYERAVVLARLTRTEARSAEAAARAAKAETELKALEDQERRVRAETEDLELRARVAADTLPMPENTPTTPERERARLESARALALQARLLCASARLLEPQRSSLAALEGELQTLDGRLMGQRAPAPIDDAVRLRSRCLAELEQVRRPQTLKEPARGTEDALLNELSSAALAPDRDDRGIAVTLRGVFAKDGSLSPSAASALQALGRVATAHTTFPVLVVLHRAGTTGAAHDQSRLDLLVSTLKTAGAARVAAVSGGTAAPLVEPGRPAASARNERVEVIFVAPSSG